MKHKGSEQYTRELSEMMERVRHLRKQARNDEGMSYDDRVGMVSDLLAVEDCISDQLANW